MTSEPTASFLAAGTRWSSRVVAWALARRWLLIVWGALSAWWIALFATLLSEYRGYQLARFDLGNMVQAVWSTAHGRPLEMTLGTGEQSLRFASHVDPILVLLAPLWTIFPSPLTLAGVQIAAVALGALPVFWLARRHLESEKAACLLALAYLTYPWLAWTALDAVHPVTFAIPLFLFAVYFLDSERLWPFALCALLVLSTGELMGLSLAALGIWYWLARGQRGAGLLIAASGFAWSVVCLKLVIPAFRGAESPFYDRFASVGGSPEGIVEKAFTDPGAILAALFSIDDLSYLVWLAAPLVGIFLLAPGLAAVALPQLFVNLLSDSSPTTDPRTHYIAAAVPFLIAGCVLGLARLPDASRMRALTVGMVFCVALGLYLGPWDVIFGRGVIEFQAKLPASHVRALDAAAEVVPDGVPVSATNRVGVRLSDRRYFYSVDVVRDAEWIVLDTWDARIVESGWQPARFKAFWGRIERSPEWTKVFSEDGVLVFRRAPRL